MEWPGRSQRLMGARLPSPTGGVQEIFRGNGDDVQAE